MGLVFFLVVTPTGFIMKIFGSDLLKRKYHKKVLKINKETIILNNGLTLDSLEFLDLIIYIEKKTKKKFLSYKNNDLINLKVKDLLKFFN